MLKLFIFLRFRYSSITMFHHIAVFSLGPYNCVSSNLQYLYLMTDVIAVCRTSPPYILQFITI